MWSTSKYTVLYDTTYMHQFNLNIHHIYMTYIYNRLNRMQSRYTVTPASLVSFDQIVFQCLFQPLPSLIFSMGNGPWMFPAGSIYLVNENFKPWLKIASSLVAHCHPLSGHGAILISFFPPGYPPYQRWAQTKSDNTLGLLGLKKDMTST